MGKPINQLRGDLRAQNRYGALVGEPANDAEAALLVLLARLLSDTRSQPCSGSSSGPGNPASSSWLLLARNPSTVLAR